MRTPVRSPSAPRRAAPTRSGSGASMDVESLRVVAADHLVQQGRVEHGAGHGAGLVEGVGQRDEPVARHPAVRRLHPDRARHRARLADGAAGVGADRERRLVRRHGRGRAAAGAAGDPAEVPRVAGRAVGRVLGGGAHRELVHVGLAQDRQARPRAGARRPWRRTAAPSPRGSASRTWWAGRVVAITSLTAIGTPSSGLQRLARWRAARRRPRPARARPRRRRAGTRARRRRPRRCGRGGPG